MKQKVVTRAIIKQDGKILLLRRKGGRPSIRGLYELPGGRVHIHQQPEDALSHALNIHLRVSTETVQLKDVMTFIDPDDRELQYVFILFEASLKPVDRTIQLDDEYDRYVWKKQTEIQQNELTQSTQQLLGMQPIPFAPGAKSQVYEANDAKDATYEKIIAFTDGGSRGNPGPSAAGFVLLDMGETVVKEGGTYLGIATNNVAEYQAVYLALEQALELGANEVSLHMDSQLVANQMNGIYRVKNADLKPVHDRIRELARKFDKVTYAYVPRELNHLADGMVNKILDAEDHE